MSRGEIRSAQKAQTVVVEQVPVSSHRNPAQRVDGDAELVLLIVEQRFDHRVAGAIVAPFEPHGLHPQGAVQIVVPPVVPGNGDWTLLGGHQACGLRLERGANRVDRHRIHAPASEDVSANVEPRDGAQPETALHVERVANETLVGRVEAPAPVDVSDVRGQDDRLRLLGAKWRARARHTQGAKGMRSDSKQATPGGFWELRRRHDHARRLDAGRSKWNRGQDVGGSDELSPPVRRVPKLVFCTPPYQTGDQPAHHHVALLCSTIADHDCHGAARRCVRAEGYDRGRCQRFVRPSS